MTEHLDQWANKLTAEHGGGWLTGFFAEEERLDRRAKARLGLWGASAVGAVTLAIMASQSSGQLRREQMASTDLLTRQAQKIEAVAREAQTDSRRLAAAIETLNGDRDRLFSRVSSVEQGLDSVTGAIKRQAVTAASPSITLPSATAESHPPQPATPPPSIGPVASVSPVAAVKPVAIAPPPPPQATPVKPASVPVAAEPATSQPALPAIGPTLMPSPLMAEKSMMAPPDSAAAPLSEPPRDVAKKPGKTDKPESAMAAVQPAEVQTAPELPAIPVQRTEFGVDLGGANTIDGLRALWRGMVASNKALDGLRPIMVLRERTNGSGMQLRLVAGPLGDAAAAAKLCATLSTGDRSCETSVYDGQRLAMKSEAAAKNDSTATITPPAPARPVPAVRRKRNVAPAEQRSEAPAAKPEEPAAKPQPSLTSFLGLR